MSDNNTTSIHDLPSDPMAGGSAKGSSNMSMSINETDYNNTNNSRSLSLDQTTISQIVNGLQQASIAGATMLPSRDIPQTTHGITSDPQIQANYVPPAESNNDYINDDDYDNDEAIHNYNRTVDVKSSLDSIYDEIQTPLLLAILYFLFQLPIIRKTLCKYIPLLCNNDGNYNINGLVFTSVIFALIFFIFSKGTKVPL
jgi:hypothetical protein